MCNINVFHHAKWHISYFYQFMLFYAFEKMTFYYQQQFINQSHSSAPNKGMGLCNEHEIQLPTHRLTQYEQRQLSERPRIPGHPEKRDRSRFIDHFRFSWHTYKPLCPSAAYMGAHSSGRGLYDRREFTLQFFYKKHREQLNLKSLLN